MKNSKLFFCAMFAVLTVAACNKNTTDPLPAKQDFQLKASCASTRTVNDGLYTRWSNGDVLAVMHAQKGTVAYIMDGPFNYVDGSDDRFTGNLPVARDPQKDYVWKALYPYSNSMTSSISDASVQIGGSQVQSALNSMAHLAGNGFPIWGSCESTGVESPSLTMTNLCSIVEVNVTNKSGFPVAITSLDLIFPEGKTIRGKYNINVSGDEPVLNYIGEGSNSTHLDITGGEEIADGGLAKFYLGITPNVLASGSVIKLKLNAFERSITLPMEVAFASGHIRKININYVGNPKNLYIVDNNGTVITLNKTSTTTYRTASMEESRSLGSTFRIAEKVSGGAIDPSGFVIGGEDYHTLSYIAADGTPINKPAVYFEYADSKPDAMVFDIEKMALNFVTVLDYNTSGDAGTYKVRWVCAMPQNSIVEFLNFPNNLSETISDDRFDMIDDAKSTARYIGMDVNYEMYAIKATGWCNFWNIGGDPKAVLLIGKNASIPLPSYTASGYTLSDAGFCANPWETIYMARISENVYRAKLYFADDFGFYFYTARTWASCVAGWTSATPETLVVQGQGTGYPYGTQNINYVFNPGIYTLELNMQTKTVSMY